MSEENYDNKLFLLDAYALVYRAYYAFIKNPRYNSKGLNTSAILGFTNTLNEVLTKENPSHIAVAFDTAAPTDREVEFEEYKANREDMPEDIALSIPYIEAIIQALRIPIVRYEGYEADDVIGTLAKKGEEHGYEVYMMSSDKDLAQLVSDNIFLYKPSSSGRGVEILGVPEVKKKYGIEDPEQLVDILGLWGDSVDNIPGVPGVGEKRARDFVQKYGSVEGLYEHVDELTGKLKEKVQDNKEQAFLSKKLARIITDVPIEFDEKDLIREEPDKERLRELFAELEFRNLAERLLGEEIKGPQTNGQMSMFDESGQVDENAPNTLASINEKEVRYELVSSQAEREKVLEELKKSGVFCFDVETTSLHPHSCDLIGVAFSVDKEQGWYLPLNVGSEKSEDLLEPFQEVFSNPRIQKIGHNIKFDISVLKWHGIEVDGTLWDTMIMHYLVDPDTRHKMDLLAEIYLKYKPVPIEDLIGKKGKGQKNMGDLDPSELYEYACEDSDITLQLKNALDPELEKVNAEELYKTIEAPLIQVLTQMEYHGVKVDRDSLGELSKEYQERIKELEKSIFGDAGVEFNINSPKQLGEVLFDKLKIVEKPKKTRSGQYSTSEDTLAKYIDKHPIIQKIFDVRSLSKLRSTYLEALPELINERTGRIHTTFNQAVAATGRLSSNEPNLQNIPIRTEEGRKIRKAFVPRNDENVLLAADYSQIELRIMAHLSDDKAMLNAFRNGEDIHASTASKVYKVPLEEVSRDQRRNAKTVNFGIIYGISAFGLSQRIGIPRKEAQQLIDTYFEEFNGVRSFMDRSIELAKEKGYVETIMGRRRYLKDINSSNSVVRGYSERNAINAPIQGSAADMIKLAMIRIHEMIKSEGWNTKMVLQVHDELVFDTPKDEVEKIQDRIVAEMKEAISLNLPIEVETGTGKNWLEAH